MAAVEARLATGTLRVFPDPSSEPIGRLVSFGARSNPKRGFLFVSKVLGRHIPVDPGSVLAAQWDLADRILGALRPGEPVLFVALAETAVGLGQGVFEMCAERHGAPCAFVHSTRTPIPGEPVCCSFEEGHSHATSHWIHEPEGEAGRIARSARTVVVVDDEQSTGRTAGELLAALSEGLGFAPGMRAVVASLCDWVSEEDRALVAEGLAGRFSSVDWVSLARGRWAFDPDPSFAAQLPEPPGGSDAGLRPSGALGRLGTCKALLSDGGLLCCGKPFAEEAQRLAKLSRDRGRPLLVLGTGECSHAPLLLAARAKGFGAEVRFQSLTRSPALVGGAFERSMEVPSPCGSAVRYYLHNGDPWAHDTVVCFETRRQAESWTAPFACEKVWFGDGSE